MSRKPVVVIIIIVILITGGFYAYKKYLAPKYLVPKEEQKKEPIGLGGQIYEQVQNPVEKIPETNPYSAKTNPFEEAKTNPFENIYTNPFGE